MPGGGAPAPRPLRELAEQLTPLLKRQLVQVQGLTMLTATGSIVGTPTYMSPEQCAGRPVDHRSDIYAFGILLFELLTGRPPFCSESIYEILDLHQNAPPPSPSTLCSELPLSLEQIILRCLEKAPEDRPADLEEVLSAFASAPPRVVPPKPPRERSGASKQRFVTIASTGGTLIVLGWLLSPLPSAVALRSSVREECASWFVSEPSLDLREHVQAGYRALSEAEAYFSVAKRHQEAGRLDRAYESYRRAAQTFGQKPEYLESLIVVSDRLGRRVETAPLVTLYLSHARANDAAGTLRRWLDEE